MVCDASTSDSDWKYLVFRYMWKAALRTGVQVQTSSAAPAQEVVGWISGWFSFLREGRKGS